MKLARRIIREETAIKFTGCMTVRRRDLMRRKAFEFTTPKNALLMIFSYMEYVLHVEANYE